MPVKGPGALRPIAQNDELDRERAVRPGRAGELDVLLEAEIDVLERREAGAADGDHATARTDRWVGSDLRLADPPLEGHRRRPGRSVVVDDQYGVADAHLVADEGHLDDASAADRRAAETVGGVDRVVDLRARMRRVIDDDGDDHQRRRTGIRHLDVLGELRRIRQPLAEVDGRRVDHYQRAGPDTGERVVDCGVVGDQAVRTLSRVAVLADCGVEVPGAGTNARGPETDFETAALRRVDQRLPGP